MLFTKYVDTARKLLRKCNGFWGKTPHPFTEKHYRDLAEHLSGLLSLDERSVYTSGFPVMNELCSKESIYNLIYHYIAVRNRLREGDIIPYKSTIPHSEVVEVRFERAYIDHDRLRMVLHFLTGTCVHTQLPVHIPKGLGYSWIGQLGYSNRNRSKYSTYALSQCISGLYGCIRVGVPAEVDSLSHCQFSLVPSNGMLAYNRKMIIKKRLGEAPCPFQWEARIRENPAYCTWACLKGWDSCMASSHRSEYTVGLCSKCGNDNAYLSEDISGECISCYRKSRNISVID